MRRLLAIITVIPLLFSACVKDPASSGKEIVTGDATDVTEASAILTGYAYTTPEMGEVTIGFVYSTDDAPSSENGEEVVSHELDEKNAFAVSISKLQPKTKYYYKAFLKYGGIYHYGKVKSFSTLEASKETGNYKAVDLGLSVNWATFNVGATKPEEYGDYFAWGETEPYYESGYAQSDSPVWKSGKESGYDWPSYIFELGTGWHRTFSKYVTQSSYGTVDNNTVLDPEDDAAHANWGGSWRMPTLAECEELLNNCTWTWTSQNGVYGRKVTGPNGNSIFLPAAGYRVNADLRNVGSAGGYFWSSSLYSDIPNLAYFVNFYSDDYYWYDVNRYHGFSVRPVSE